MSANMVYHFNKLRERIDETFVDSERREAAQVLLNFAQKTLEEAQRVPETDFDDSTRPEQPRNWYGSSEGEL